MLEKGQKKRYKKDCIIGIRNDSKSWIMSVTLKTFQRLESVERVQRFATVCRENQMILRNWIPLQLLRIVKLEEKSSTKPIQSLQRQIVQKWIIMVHKRWYFLLILNENASKCKIKLSSNRNSESVVFNSGQKMALRALYVVIC